MIKYIKTKDNRIVKIDLEDNRVFTSKYEVISFPEDDVEELCDEFLFVLNHNNLGKLTEHILIKKEHLEYFKLLTKDIKNSLLYGAIWTEWGLRYVAKMKRILPNDKIDWELL